MNGEKCYSSCQRRAWFEISELIHESEIFHVFLVRVVFPHKHCDNISCEFSCSFQFIWFVSEAVTEILKPSKLGGIDTLWKYV
jgi:hypothetical protein